MGTARGVIIVAVITIIFHRATLMKHLQKWLYLHNLFWNAGSIYMGLQM